MDDNIEAFDSCFTPGRGCVDGFGSAGRIARCLDGGAFEGYWCLLRRKSISDTDPEEVDAGARVEFPEHEDVREFC